MARSSRSSKTPKTKAIPEFTRASLFGEVGKQTLVFVRFSTVLGERGSTDAFVAAIAKHRHFARETDPPRV